MKKTIEECDRFIIKGLVQGVFFRASTQEKALELGIRGFVRNLNDGSVEVCGAGDNIEKLYEWLKVGPRQSRVDEVQRSKANESLHTLFAIERSL